jgi:hypothetical protein
MPFRAVLDGETVAPAEVDNRQEVECPECGAVMYPRGGSEVARHFYHVDEQQAESCAAAGESDTHHRCKALALEAVKTKWGDTAERYGVEIPVDVSFTPSEPSWRIADVLLEFKSRNRFFGKGLIIEVQHKNREKDIRGTTYDYISADYSVAWLEPDHFEEEHLDYSVVDDMFAAYPRSHNWQGVEPIDVGHAISIRHRSPDTLGPLPDDIETYHSYPNPKTDISERRWDIMKNPWR